MKRLKKLATVVLDLRDADQQVLDIQASLKNHSGRAPYEKSLTENGVIQVDDPRSWWVSGPGNMTGVAQVLALVDKTERPAVEEYIGLLRERSSVRARQGVYRTKLKEMTR